MGITATLLLGIIGVVLLLYWWRRRYAIQLTVQQGISGSSPTSPTSPTSPQNIQPISYIPNERVDENVEEPPTSTSMKEGPTISLTKAAVSFAVENVAETSMCTECRENSTFPGICQPSPFPHYGRPLPSTAEIQSFQTRTMIPEHHESNASLFKVSRLSLDSAWSDSSGTESVLRQVAEQLKPLRSPQLLHSLKQQSIHTTFCPPSSQGQTTQAHKPAHH